MLASDQDGLTHWLLLCPTQGTLFVASTSTFEALLHYSNNEVEVRIFLDYFFTDREHWCDDYTKPQRLYCRCTAVYLDFNITNLNVSCVGEMWVFNMIYVFLCFGRAHFKAPYWGSALLLLLFIKYNDNKRHSKLSFTTLNYCTSDLCFH